MNPLALLRRTKVTVGNKIILIIMILAAPFALMTKLYLNQIGKDIAFAQLELDGSRYIETLWPMLVDAESDQASRSTELRRRPASADEAFKSKEAVDAFAAAAGKAGQSAIEVAEAGRTAISKVADGSNLTLDPDLDSYYLMDASTVRLPELATSIFVLKDALKPYGAAGAKPNGKALRALVAAATRYQAARAAAVSSLSAAQDGNPDGTVRTALKASTATFEQATADADTLIDTTLLKAESAERAPAADLERALTSVTNATRGLWTRSESELVRLLQARIDGFAADRWQKMAIVGAALALAALVLVLVIGSIRKPLTGVLGAIGRFQAGDFLSAVPHADLNNEFGEIARALRKLQGMSGEQALTTAGINGSGMMLMITDSDDRIMFLSNGLTQLFMELEPYFRAAKENFSVNAMYGEHIDYYGANANLKRELISDDGRRRRVRYEVGGHVIDVDMSNVQDANGRRVGSVLAWTDITAELAAEREIAEIVGSAGHGDFSRRVALEGKKSTAREIALGLNAFADLVENATTDFAASLTALAAGDLTRPVANQYDGVFGRLQESINHTIERLAETLGTIQRTAAEVATAATEIQMGSTDLAQRTEDQAASLEENAATTEELAASVKASAQSARLAATMAEKAKQSASDGGAIVVQAVSAISRIEESSRRIADITSVIDDIAFQTNLLALNAAVEAARAGEAGKGFAVVASEVRTLAQRSSEAAKDITGLITSSTNEVVTGVKLVKSAGDALEQIVLASREVADTIAEISSSTAEQATGIDEIASAISTLDSATQQNAALAEESAASAASLTTQIQDLEHLVSGFRIEAERPSGGRRRAA
ncbi:hypothetical protein GCM10007036_42260 [Alsobacter metallidurans]|uniref:Methyl-accepting chemotaxis protein n=1 Tax=Alsobacter metallidurans TaxID=340221 RepID=A0A917IBW3_9HYPH|nr:methyl-accepting chemotaxis protein [Alsobacter metallidurans]GGH31212.1 hypothetical protein GCM10007036_42260 [Alsobacter metallidurans]